MDIELMQLQHLLPQITPLAIEWAQARSAEILAVGESLTPAEIELARQMGVNRPELVRLLMVDRLPMPESPMLAQAAMGTGLLGPGIVGLTLGYGIYICRGHRTTQLVSHECRHVYQYEQAGSIGAFLGVYLQQIAQHGYAQAPLEIDAYSHQITA
ncbi:MAG: hypothetical protein A2Z93_01735 [Curvibacter sp. GWA2_64_110]|nr:hypothetical protein [Hylemonella sp.]MDP1936430.1 hypothetical protein [Hylemonella sp.]OGP03136.1 MAG: hypothetical protein A2Z93_01735 [Curvibacter sp. GWA2_64_110]